MKNNVILRSALFLGSVFGTFVTSHATEVDCTTKVGPTFCAVLNQASADSDTFSVSIIFFLPTKDTSEYCRNLDPKQDTNGQCSLSGYDSAYYAKLKSDAHTMFTNFELWDAKHPTVRLTSPSSGTPYHTGIVATKATLIEVLKEGYISTISDWENYGPIKIISHAATRIEGMKSQGKSFLPNGKVISSKVPVMRRSFYK
jgi:hypothetical protein